MWFCRICDQWFDDNVAVLTHLQTLHSKAQSSNKKGIAMVSDRIMAPGSVFTNKQISILKSAKSLGMIRKSQFVKVKPNDPKLVNGFPHSKALVKTSTASKEQANVTSILPKSVSYGSPTISQNVKIMQVAKTNDLASLSKLIAKKMTNKASMLEQIKTYICKFCCRKFPNSTSLDTHQKSHGPNPNHACHLCGAIASNFSSLMCHFVKHSSGKSLNYHTGPDRDKVSMDDALKKVVPKQDSGIACTQCKRTFNTKEVFNSHYCPALNKKSEYECAYCRKVTTTVEEYRDHIQSHSASPFVCSSCKTQFSKKSQLSTHLSICPRKKKVKIETNQITSSRNKRKIKLATPQHKSPPKKGILKTNLDVKNTEESNHALDEEEVSPLKEDNSTIVIKETALSQSLPDLSQSEDLNDLSTATQKETDIAAYSEPVIKTRRRRRKTIEMLSQAPVDERPTRNLRSPSRYAADSNSPYAPTRRSARLVNRKRITFSDDEDELSENEIDLEPEIKIEIIKSEEETVIKMEPEYITEPIKEDYSDVIIKKEPEEEEEEEETATEAAKKKGAPRKRIRKTQNKTTALYCQVCSLLFRSIGSLRRHKKMHTGKPQFVCQFCGKFFFRRDIHLRHENSVHQNSADKGFSCYYCKQRFESSDLLKEHSTAAHVTKALVPERIRRCTGVNKSPKKSSKSAAPSLLEKKGIKEELLEVSKTMLPSIYDDCQSPISKSLTTVCNFQEAEHASHDSDLQEHMDMKPTTIQLNSCLLQKEFSNSSDIKPNDQSVTMSKTRARSREFKEMVLNAPSVIDNCSVKETNSRGIGFNSGNVCNLCSKELTEDQDSICGPQVTHKVVDWYQCLVCAYSGTKSQVQEHMLTHTYKIGTLVVSEEDQDYNSVRTFLPLFSDALTVPENNDDSAQDGEEPNILQQTFGESDLPRENDSPCTLMEEIKCVKCGEVIIDCEVLTQHPCIKIANDFYSCFVGLCYYSSSMKSDMQNHLVEHHYTTPFSNMPSRPMRKRKIAEKSHRANSYSDNTPQFKRHTQIENIFIEPSLES